MSSAGGAFLQHRTPRGGRDGYVRGLTGGTAQGASVCGDIRVLDLLADAAAVAHGVPVGAGPFPDGLKLMPTTVGFAADTGFSAALAPGMRRVGLHGLVEGPGLLLGEVVWERVRESWRQSGVRERVAYRGGDVMG